MKMTQKPRQNKGPWWQPDIKCGDSAREGHRWKSAFAWNEGQLTQRNADKLTSDFFFFITDNKKPEEGKTDIK